MQRNFLHPATVLNGRKLVRRWRRDVSIRKAIPYFQASRDVLGVVFLIIIYVWSRLTAVMALPMFYDEVIYLLYAREYIADPVNNLLISAVRDGKPPLFIWGLAWFYNLFPDPLAGGRFMSVLGGALACVFIYLTGKRLHSSMAGFLATFFYIVSPIMILHNRFAFHTSWETAAGVATLYFAVALAQRPAAVYALGLAAAIILGMFIKQTALFYFGLAPMVVYVLRRRPDIMAKIKTRDAGGLRKVSLWWYNMRVPKLNQHTTQVAKYYQPLFAKTRSTTIWKLKSPQKWQSLKNWFAGSWRFVFMATAVVAGLVLALAGYVPLLTHPKGSYLSSSDTSYAFSLAEVLGLPLEVWRVTFGDTWDWYNRYYGYVYFALVTMAFGYAFLRPKKAQTELILLAWAILPIFAQLLLARYHWYPRYIVAFGPPLMLLAAIVLLRLADYLIKVSRERLKWSGAFGVFAVGVFALATVAPTWNISQALITDPINAPMSAKDRWQYVEGWPSGYGMEESISYIRELAAQNSVLLFIDQDNVTPEIYFHYRLDHLRGWIMYARTDRTNWNVRNFQGERNSYYITTVQPPKIIQPYLKEMKIFSKPGGQTSMAIYKFVPPEYKLEPPAPND
jgi:4-amino-4-deoxy-L-arabinose transferase-like glycosyltransferase